MAKTLTLDPKQQAIRRRRARVTQPEMAARLNVSLSAISKYETGKENLPWELTPEDYESALVEAISEKESRP